MDQDRYKDGYTSNPERLNDGEMLRRLILSAPANRGIVSILRPCLEVPFGVNSIYALVELPTSEFAQPTIWLKSPLPRHNKPNRKPYSIAIFNEWTTVSSKHFNRFKRAARDFEFLKECLLEDLGVPLQWTFKRIAESLEAILAIRHPVSLIRIFNFIDDAAQPCLINLSRDYVIEKPVIERNSTKGRYYLSRKLVCSYVKRRRSDGLSPL